MVDTAQTQAGMRVLIHGGSGGVGSVAIQIAHHFGADIYATCHSANVERVEKLGAHAISYDLEDFTSAVSDCDVVLDTVGGQVHEDSYKVLKKGGRLVYLLARPFNDLSADYDVEDIQVNVFGNTANLVKVIDFARKGIIKPHIGHSLGLDDFDKAFELSESGNAGGKIVLNLDKPRQSPAQRTIRRQHGLQVLCRNPPPRAIFIRSGWCRKSRRSAPVRYIEG